MVAEWQGLAWIGSHPWIYPALEVLHIVGIAMLLGNLMLLELRVWGHAPALPIVPLARASLLLALVGFSLIAASGLTATRRTGFAPRRPESAPRRRSTAAAPQGGMSQVAEPH